MELSWRLAQPADAPLLAVMNRELAEDELHRNAALPPEQFELRMRDFLSRDYRAIIFESGGPVAYALFADRDDGIYLRQFFVRRDRRRLGIGRAAMLILRNSVWPAGRRVYVEALSGNGRGIAFWRSVGFRDYCLTMELNGDGED